jgi:hypothetical protein
MSKSRDVAFADYDVLDAAARVCDRIAAKSGTDASLAAAGAALRVVTDIERGAAVAMKDDGGQIHAVYKSTPTQQVRYKENGSLSTSLWRDLEAAAAQAGLEVDAFLRGLLDQAQPARQLTKLTDGDAPIMKEAPPRDVFEAAIRGLPATSVKARRPATHDPIMTAIRQFTGDE